MIRMVKDENDIKIPYEIRFSTFSNVLFDEIETSFILFKLGFRSFRSKTNEAIAAYPLFLKHSENRQIGRAHV